MSIARGSSSPTATLYVGNLPDGITKSDLMKAFDGCIKVTVICNEPKR